MVIGLLPPSQHRFLPQGLYIILDESFLTDEPAIRHR